MSTVDDLPVVKEGVWLYAETVPVRIQILSTPETWGTGDYEDDESIAENQRVPCYILAYESAGSPGRFNNVVPNLMSIPEALAYVEQRFPGIKWL